MGQPLGPLDYGHPFKIMAEKKEGFTFSPTTKIFILENSPMG